MGDFLIGGAKHRPMGFQGGDYFLPLPCNGLFCATIELDTNQMTSFYFLAQIATSYKLDLSDLCPAKWLFEYQKEGRSEQIHLVCA